MATTKLTEDVKGNPLPCEYIQLDETLVEHLKVLPEWIDNDWDFWALIIGIPGSGKTHFAMRCALYLNSAFSLEDIVFTLDELEEWIDTAMPGEVCLFDESDVMADHHSSRRMNRLKRLAKRCRSKKLIVLNSTPTLKDINNFFVSRSRFIAYIYAKSIENRGWYHYYSGPEKPMMLYIDVKMSRAETPSVYHRAKSTIKNGYIGRSVPDDWPIDSVAYDKKKDAALSAAEDGLTPKQVELSCRRNWLKNFYRWFNLKFDKDPIQTDAAAVFGVDQATISNDLRELEDWS